MKQLSQAEIWDDSALLQSWDDALAEYKLYHCMQARGERVEDVIRMGVVGEEHMDRTEDDVRQAAARMQTSGVSLKKLVDGELEERPESAQTYPSGESTNNPHGPLGSESSYKQPLANASIAADEPANPAMPKAVTNGVKEETLKNLMMSWYYAGYYSGLYEGQQQVQSHLSRQDI